MENQNNLVKHNKSIDRNHSKTFAMKHAPRGNFITPRQCVKILMLVSLTIDTKNQFQPLENLIEEQSNKSELNMAQETANNLQNDPTMRAEKSVEKLPSSTDPANNNLKKRML